MKIQRLEVIISNAFQKLINQVLRTLQLKIRAQTNNIHLIQKVKA